MGSIGNAVHYCCVSKSKRVLYAYNGGDHEIENLAFMCLEKTPTFHNWYFETKSKRTFGFLIEDEYVNFTIVDDGFGKPGLLKFLEHLRDEFKSIAKKSPRTSFSSMNTAHFQEHLVPVIRHLIFSLEHVSGNENDRKAEISSPSNVNGMEVFGSTKAPLLGKSSKHEKKKTKDHVISVRDNELEERRKSTDRGVKVDESSNQGGTISPQKDLGSIRMRSSPQNIRRKWWRQVIIVLAIDAVVCLVLFVVWLSICHGFECTH